MTQVELQGRLQVYFGADAPEEVHAAAEMLLQQVLRREAEGIEEGRPDALRRIESWKRKCFQWASTAAEEGNDLLAAVAFGAVADFNLLLLDPA